MHNAEAQLTVFYYDLSVREIKRVQRGRVKFVIVHRYGVNESGSTITRRCVAGEEIASAWLVFRGRSHQLPLSPPHLLLFDYLCFHRGIAQSASEIEAGLNEEMFYVHHASLAKRNGVVIPRTTRTAVRKQVERIRSLLSKLFIKERLPLNPLAILRSEPTSTLEVKYKVHADVSWEH